MPINYRPRELNTLENLLTGVNNGLAPDFALGVLQDTQQSALDRLLQQRAMRQERQTQMQALLPEAASTLGQFAQAGLPGTVGAAAYSAAPPRAQGALAGLLGTLYPQGLEQTSPFAVGGPTTPATDPEMLQTLIANIEDTADVNLEGGPEAGGFFETLGALRSRWTAMGLDPETIRHLRDYFERVWTSRGGTIPGAPTQAAATPAQGTFVQQASAPLGVDPGVQTRWQDVFGLFPGLFG